MLEMLLGIVGLVALIFVASLYKELGSTKTQLKEYKALFEASSQESRLSQSKIEVLLSEAVQHQRALERGAAVIEVANAKLREQLAMIAHRTDEVGLLQQTISFQEGQYAKLLTQKKSSEVRTGKITEQISPFLADYPLDPKTARFLGDPIDFVHFDEDKVTFVEVKSGKSQLSKRQRQIRDLVKDGKVEFIIYRVEGKP